MMLRIYAVVVTVLLVAALTNPSAQKQYAKLERVYPWITKSYFVDAQTGVVLAGPRGVPESREGTYPAPVFTYYSNGFFSYVCVRGRWPRIQTRLPVPEHDGVAEHRGWPPSSIGAFGYVYTKDKRSFFMPRGTRD